MSKHVEAPIVPIEASVEGMIELFGSGLKIDGTPQKCVESTKTLRDKLTKELEDFLSKDKDINTTVQGEHDKKDKPVNVRRILNPLVYAWHLHEEYMGKVPQGTKILFVGMNPSPSSLTGIPFYEKDAMTNLFGAPLLTQLLNEMPAKYRGNETSESGQRFWEFVFKKFGSYDKFFRYCFIINYCPLIFMNKDGGNVPLDGFNDASQSLLKNLMAISDSGLKDIIDHIKPTLIIGIGRYAFNRVRQANTSNIKCYQIRHPSPATGMTSDQWMNKIGGFLENNMYWGQAMKDIELEEFLDRLKDALDLSE